MGILGSLVLTSHGVNFVPSAPKPKQLLAFLMTNANELVRASDCIVELWGARPPKSVMSTLQTYVLHIRQILRSAAPVDRSDILVTRNQGYQLVTGTDHFDRFRFERLVWAARWCVSVGDDERASDFFAAALGLWRGPALADVRPGRLSMTHVVELAEVRNAVVEQRIEADLRLGRHEELLDELSTRVSLHPTHENACAQYMVALYRSGDRDRALAAFERLRQVLGDTLGIEPAPPIRRLRHAILTADAVLDLNRRPPRREHPRVPSTVGGEPPTPPDDRAYLRRHPRRRPVPAWSDPPRSRTHHA
ncbi:AfsR/SARP family transcriptional regulator [Saccharothrix obliqua]|uniref:AfsR/SARP family transcriptional regulator n=1 Tax=Saccharothrix obliqua TaxID=2861747 RepID=UPI001C5DB146|nr:AfsR/SARP family transcriptional regulator [Saccharothrix obliqua]MBW4717525.1 AfsR/SARP family transcriptional regulator [Saccharothrix obliqua]